MTEDRAVSLQKVAAELRHMAALLPNCDWDLAADHLERMSRHGNFNVED